MTTENLATLALDKDQKKVLGLNAVPIIKHDILCSAKNYVDTLYDSLSDEYRKELLLRLDEIWKRFEDASLEDKNALIEEIKKLYEGQEEMIKSLNAVKNAIKGLEQGTDEDGNPGSVLDPDEVKLILMAALVDKAFWTDEMIGAPTVIGNQIVGLIGLFGKVKAGNITGDLIEGKTVQSFDKTTLVSGTKYLHFNEDGENIGNDESDGTHKGPAWQLREDGDGYLAGGRISWDKNGITYKDISIKFEDIEDGDKYVKDLIDASQNNKLTVEELIQSWLADNKLSPAELEQLTKLRSDIEIEHDRVIKSVNQLNSVLDAIEIKINEEESKLDE